MFAQNASSLPAVAGTVTPGTITAKPLPPNAVPVRFSRSYGPGDRQGMKNTGTYNHDEMFGRVYITVNNPSARSRHYRTKDRIAKCVWEGTGETRKIVDIEFTDSLDLANYNEAAAYSGTIQARGFITTCKNDDGTFDSIDDDSSIWEPCSDPDPQTRLVATADGF